MANEEVGIRLTLQGRREAAADLDQTEQQLDEVGDAAEQAGKKAEASSKRWGRLRGVMGTVGRGVMRGVGILGALGAAGAGVGLKVAAGMENARIGFTTMLGSARKAKAFLSDLEKFAAKTPFEFPELQTAASSLVSAGINADKVIPIMTTLGDVTAGMGTGSEGIKRATVALQQMNAAGKISAEDLNQLRDAGLPVYDLLAAALGKTKAEVSKLRDEGKLGGDALTAMMRALETGKGLERFNGLMGKQSKSLNGSWSTLEDTVSMGLARAIKPALPLVKELLTATSRFAERAMPALRRGVKSLVGGFKDIRAEYEAGGVKGVLASLRGKGSGGSGKQLAGIGAGLGTIGTALAEIDWGNFKESLGGGVTDTINVFAVVIGFAADHVDLLGKALPFLVGGLIAYKAAQAASNVVVAFSFPLRIAEYLATRAQTKELRKLTALQAGAVGTTTALATTTGVQAGTTTAAAGAQRGLNAAMRANPIGAVITAAMLLVGGFILLYKNSDTFRGMVDGLWNNVLKPFGSWIGGVLVGYLKTLAKMWLSMGRFGIKAFTWLLRAAFNAFDGILSAAEKGLGWVPGLGKKIKGARAAFNEFGDATIGKLQRLDAKLKATQDKIDGIARDRSATINITTAYTNTKGFNPTRGRGDEFAGRARGGPVQARRPYVVGEHRPELFVPNVPGMIIPKVPDLSDLTDVDVAVGPAGPGGPPLVRVTLPDGRVLFEAMADEFDDAEANA